MKKTITMYALPYVAGDSQAYPDVFQAGPWALFRHRLSISQIAFIDPQWKKHILKVRVTIESIEAPAKKGKSQ